MKKSIIVGAIAAIVATAALAADAPTTPGSRSAIKKTGPAIPLDLGPVHNGFRMGRKIISGSCPYGDAGFAALAKHGVRTVISVDGARPDEARAKKYGMRYVHIPVTYAHITRPQALSIARAVRDLKGPVFIHCHHGIHRGPAAAVLAAMVNEGWTTQQAQDALKQAGTALQYTGLWAAARDFRKPTKIEVDRADASFPASAPVPALAGAMVSIDERWGHLGEVRAAGWKAPPSHPDIDPPHEAMLLREEFRELARSPETAKFPADYLKKLHDSESAAASLEAALRARNRAAAGTAYTALGASCKSCHAVYRDPGGQK